MIKVYFHFFEQFTNCKTDKSLIQLENNLIKEKVHETFCLIFLDNTENSKIN